MVFTSQVKQGLIWNLADN